MNLDELIWELTLSPTKLFPLLMLQSILPQHARSGSVPLDGICSTNNTRVDPATYRLLTDCDERAFCSSAINGTCQAKLCRRDEFSFGSDPKDILPPLCAHGTFCSDEGSGCQNLTQVGQPCQMNRDEQCAPSPRTADLASSDDAICLLSFCM